MYTIKIALELLLRIINSLILIRVILTFFPTLRSSQIAYFIYQMTEPILAPCRAILDKLGLGMGMIDCSPLLAMILLNLLQTMVFAL